MLHPLLVISRPLLLLAPILLAVACSDGQGNQPAEDPFRKSAEAAARQIKLDWMRAPLLALADDAMEGRGNLTRGGKKAREYLMAQMKAVGLTPLGRSGWEQPFAQGVNLVGVIPGADPVLKEEVVMISGHYDHLGMLGLLGSQCKASSHKAKSPNICNGASDNAAGVSLVLAVARALKQSATGTRRSILVVFWDAEEDGLLGSKYFAEQDPIVPLEKLAAMITVDQIGAEMIPSILPFFAIGLEYSSGMRQRIHANDAALGTTTLAVSSFFVGSETGGRSDHLPFRLKSVPIIFFSSGAPSFYHTPADEVEVVKVDRMLDMAQRVLLSLADVANASSRPSFVSSPSPHLDDARALIHLGEAIIADPQATGLDPSTVSMIKLLLDKLRQYVASPPQTEAQWQEYQTYIKSVIKLVFSYIGR